MVLQVNCIRTIKEELTSITYKLCQKKKRRNTFSNLFYEISVNLIAMPDQDITAKKTIVQFLL